MEWRWTGMYMYMNECFVIYLGRLVYLLSKFTYIFQSCMEVNRLWARNFVGGLEGIIQKKISRLWLCLIDFMNVFQNKSWSYPLPPGHTPVLSFTNECKYKSIVSFNVTKICHCSPRTYYQFYTGLFLNQPLVN